MITKDDRHTATWKRVKEYAESRIDRLRQRNDGHLDAITTASIRGEIRALKELVALETDLPIVADDVAE